MIDIYTIFPIGPYMLIFDDVLFIGAYGQFFNLHIGLNHDLSDGIKKIDNFLNSGFHPAKAVVPGKNPRRVIGHRGSNTIDIMLAKRGE